MKNPMASNGIAEELIRSFIQFGCAELHAKTSLEKVKAKVENGLIDVSDNETLTKHLQLMDEYTEDIETYTQLRRAAMLQLFRLYKGNEELRKEMWCSVKHLGIGMMTAFEAYQASEKSTELYSLYMKANQAFIRAVSRFLGIEITDCASCFADFLKAERGEDEETIS